MAAAVVVVEVKVVAFLLFSFSLASGCRRSFSQCCYSCCCCHCGVRSVVVVGFTTAAAAIAVSAAILQVRPGTHRTMTGY